MTGLYLFFSKLHQEPFRSGKLPFQRASQLPDPFLHNTPLLPETDLAPVPDAMIDREIERQYQAMPAHLRELVSWDYYLEQSAQRRDTIANQLRDADKPKLSLLSNEQLAHLAVLRLYAWQQQPLHWMHLAHAFQGMALELDRAHAYLADAKFETWPQTLAPLNYGDQRPLQQASGPFPALLHGPEEAAAEREWRLIRPSKSAHKTEGQGEQEVLWYRMPANVIRRILIGHRADPAEVKQLAEWLQRDTRFRRIPLHTTCIDPYRFRIHTQPLDNPELIRGALS